VRWEFGRARDIFGTYRTRWDAINRARGNHPLLDSKFVEPLVQHFASEGTLLGVLEDRHDPAMVLVDRVRPGFWQTFQPSQAPIGLVLLGADAAAEQVGRLMRDLPGLTLGVSLMQQDPEYPTGGVPAPSPTVETVEYISIPRITLRGSFEDYWRSRGRDLVQNLTRRRRRLVERGVRLELIVQPKPEGVGACIDEYGILETAGWKGREGTAVASDNVQGRFYREILENFCRDGEGAIYHLSMDGRVVASDLCVQRNGMLIVLKTAYDEDEKSFSPGLLLHEEMLRDAFASGTVRVLEFYGRVREWHTKWTDEIRTMYHINVYRRPAIARARRAVKWCRGRLAARARA
jgi:hypothetical protein